MWTWTDDPPPSPPPPPPPRPLPRGLVTVGVVLWAILFLAGAATGQVTTETTLGPDGFGRILLSNPAGDARAVTVSVWESEEQEGVELIREVPGVTVYPDSFSLAPGARQTVRVHLPVDSLGYAPGRLLRVRVVFAPTAPPAEQSGEVRTVLQHRYRFLTKLYMPR